MDSLAHPGGNATGLSSMSFDLAAKEVGTFKVIVSRVCPFSHPCKSQLSAIHTNWKRDEGGSRGAKADG